MDLEQCLALASSSVGGGTVFVAPSPEEADALLNLARAVAHASERKTAPLASFAVGVALAGLQPAERVIVIRAATAVIDTARGDGDAGA